MISKKWAILTALAVAASLVLSACAAPTPAVVEKEVVVEKLVVETVVVEKLVVVTPTPKPLTRVVFVQAHAAGVAGEEGPMYAVPESLGFFEEEGLDVVWEFSSGSAASIQLLLAGNAHIVNANAEAVFTTRNQGGPVMAVMAVKGRSGYAIAVLPDSPIEKLEDVKGKVIGVSSMGTGAIPIIAGELANVGLERDVDYEFVATGIGAQAATALTTGKVDGLGLWDATFAVIENQGIEMRYIHLPILDKIAPFSMVTTDKFMQENPDVVEGFARAMVKGFIWSLANPDATMKLFYHHFPAMKPLGISPEEAVRQDRRVFEMWMDNAAQFQEPLWGYQWPEKWEFSQSHYVESGLLDQERDPTQYYTNVFVEACNDFDKDALRAAAEKYEVTVEW